MKRGLADEIFGGLIIMLIFPLIVGWIPIVGKILGFFLFLGGGYHIVVSIGNHIGQEKTNEQEE